MWLGLVITSVLIGLALFLSARTTNYWQAWVYLGIGAVSSVLLTVFVTNDPILLENRTTMSGPIGEKTAHSENYRIVYRTSGHRRFHRTRA